MPNPVFPLDHLYPLDRVGAYIGSAQTFIRDSWIAFNNDAPQVFERGTAIVTRVAPNILDFMSGTPSQAIPTGPSVITSWLSPGPTLETITRSGCKKWFDMQLNACEVELNWTTSFAWVLVIILIVLVLILLLFCCCGRSKTVDKEMGTNPEPESEPVESTAIDNLRKHLVQQEKDCDEEKADLRDRLAQQEKQCDEERASLQKRLAQQQEECDDEISNLRRDLDQSSKDNDILRLELQAAGPSATATDKDDFINAQRDQLKGQLAILEAERGVYLRLLEENGGLKQDQVKSAQQVDKLERDLAEAKRHRDAERQEYKEEKHRLGDEITKAHRQLELAQHDILALLGQINALEKAAARSDVKNQDTQSEQKTKNQGSQTETKIWHQGTQTLVDQKTQTTANVAIQTGTSIGTSPTPQAPSIQAQLSDDDRITRLGRENLRLQNQYDIARRDVARLRRAHEEHGKYQKTLEGLLASSKIVEQNVKEINERCPHSHNGCEPRVAASPTSSRHSSGQGSAQDLSEIEEVDENKDKPDCDSTRCHKCPWFAGEKHHICVKSGVEVPITENTPVSKPQSGEEVIPGKDVGYEDEDEVETPIPPLFSRVPKLGPAPVISYPSPPLPPSIPLIPVKPEIPSISTIDFLENRMGELKIPPIRLPTIEISQRVTELRESLRESFRTDYNAFQAEARRTRCSGTRHTKKLEYAADVRSVMRNKIVGQTWTPEFDIEDFQKRCKEVLRTWVEGHAQDRKHLSKQCSQEDIGNSKDCLPADPVEPALDFDSEGEAGTRPVPKRPNSDKSRGEDWDSLFGDSDDASIIPGLPTTNADTKDGGISDKRALVDADTGTSGLENPLPLAPIKPNFDPIAVLDAIKPAPAASSAGTGCEAATVNPKVQAEPLKTPTKPWSEQANPGSAVSDLSSNVPPTPPAAAGKPNQPSGEKPSESGPTTQHPTNQAPSAVNTPLVPPSLPLPFQESLPDAILMYEVERGHEFTRLPTSGSGFLCGVNAVGLTTAHMHPEIQGLTAAALMEVLDWQEYRDVVDDSRFAYRDNQGQLISPTNRTFFAVDQLASMIGLWGSRRGLDLRLGVNREDYGPSVYGGIREGRTVILWIHHDNNEERTRDSLFPMVDHFSGYKRVPAETFDEAKAKKEAADKQAQDLREAESKAKQDAAEEQSKRNAELKDKQDAEEQSMKDTALKSAQSLREAQDKKNDTSAAPLLFGKYTPSVDFGGGFNPPPPPPVIKKPMIDWGNSNFLSVDFNQPTKSSNIKDSHKVTSEETEHKPRAIEAAEKAHQAAISQTLENIRRADSELRAKQDAQKQEQEAVAAAERAVRENEQLRKQIQETVEQEEIARADILSEKDLDQDMVDVPAGKPDDVDMEENSDSSGLSEVSQDKVNALINFNNSEQMDEGNPEETTVTDGPHIGPDSGDDWSQLSGAALERKVLEDQAANPIYPPPSKPWHVISHVGPNATPGFFSGNAFAPTGNRTPRVPVTNSPSVNTSPGFFAGNTSAPTENRTLNVPVTNPPFVNPSPGFFSGNAVAPTGNRTPRESVTSPAFVPRNTGGADNQQQKNSTQGKYDVAKKPPKQDEYVLPPTPPKLDEKEFIPAKIDENASSLPKIDDKNPSPSEGSDDPDSAQFKDLYND